MEGRHQRRALAAAATSRLRKSATTSMPLSSARSAGAFNCTAAVGAVAHGLSVGADGDYIARRDAGCVEQAGGRVGIETRQRIGRQRGARQFVGAGLVQRQQLGAQGGGHVQAGAGQHLRLAVGQPGQHAVDTVDAGADIRPI